ncbi:MAG: SLC13 family permease [Clostridium sp.]|uniref:SLC13 family permease n=1 Tax=Clostridium sp. TaxID=1506 RepID=UPI003EE791CA
MNVQQILASGIFIVILLGIITEKFDLTVLSLTGAILMVAVGIIPLSKVMGYVDFNTIAVLFGMMAIVAVFKRTGFFEYIAMFTAKICRGNSLKIIFTLGILAAFFSGVLDNVTTVLLMGPVTILITRLLKVNPIPFMIVEIFAANIGGTGTLIGDPPNIMIGSAAHLSFVDFLVKLFPITIVILILTIGIIYYIYRKELLVNYEEKVIISKLNPRKEIKNKKLLIQTLVVILIVLIAFIISNKIGMSVGEIAIIGACVLLLISKINFEDIVKDIEWGSILFFIGLFIMVGGLVQVGIINMLAHVIIHYGKTSPVLLMLIMLWGSAIISTFLNNIPFVATLIPLVLVMQKNGVDVSMLWWAISLGSCLGGNGSLIGASANVVLANVSEKNGYKIKFGEYFKIGFPLMILSIIISSIYLLALYYF